MGQQLYHSRPIPLPPSEATGDSYRLWAEAVTDELNSLQQVVYDVRDFGAVADGITSDSTAIQGAIDTAEASGGGRIFIPPGIYSLAQTVSLTSNIEIFGSGTSTILLHDASTNTLLWLNGATLAPAGLRLRHFSIFGGTGTGDAIALDGTAANNITDVVIEDVRFNGIGGASAACVRHTRALEVYISNCLVTNAVGIGFSYDSLSNACVVRDCVMSNNGTGDIAIDCNGAANVIPQEGLLIEGNVIENWRGTAGVRLVNAGNTTLARNWFEGNDGHDLQINSATVGNFVNNVMLLENRFASSRITTDSSISAREFVNLTAVANDFRHNVILQSSAGGSVGFHAAFMCNNYASSATFDDQSTLADDILVRIAERDQPEAFNTSAATIRVGGTHTPTGTSSGSTGDMTWDSNYIYVCQSTDSWSRATLNTF